MSCLFGMVIFHSYFSLPDGMYIYIYNIYVYEKYSNDCCGIFQPCGWWPEDMWICLSSSPYLSRDRPHEGLWRPRKKTNKQFVCLKTWNTPLFQPVFCFFPCDVSIIVQQTPLCFHRSSPQVNGVAAIHTEIIKKESFNSQLLKGGVYYWLTYRILT